MVSTFINLKLKKYIYGIVLLKTLTLKPQRQTNMASTPLNLKGELKPKTLNLKLKVKPKPTWRRPPKIPRASQ